MKDVLLLYSGGLDSMLSLCRLVGDGYRVNLIHFDNGSSIGSKVVSKGALNLVERFGEDRVRFLGVFSTVGVINSFKKIENQKFSSLSEKYGNMSISQYQCLLCRSAMYYYAASIALENNFHYIAEGARKVQKFAIEQTPMIEEYRSFLNKYGLELLTPVLDLVDDYEKVLEISRHGVIPKKLEGKCFLGYPLDEKYPVDDGVVNDTVNMFRELVLPEMEELMNDEYHDGFIKNLKYGEHEIKWM